MGDPAVVGAAVEAAVVGVVLELPQFQVAINLEINVEDLPLLLVVEGYSLRVSFMIVVALCRSFL